MSRGAAAAAMAMFLATLATPGVLRAVVVLDSSIGGVRVGMTKREVRETLGKPFVAYDYRRHHLRVLFFARPAVVEVITTSRAERLANGVGVGTSVTELRRKIPHLRRQTFDGLLYVHRPHGITRPSTLFAIRHGRVAQINVVDG